MKGLNIYERLALASPEHRAWKYAMWHIWRELSAKTGPFSDLELGEYDEDTEQIEVWDRDSTPVGTIDVGHLARVLVAFHEEHSRREKS